MILTTDCTGTENIYLKVLVPSVAAGAIIGKGGETITQIQKDTGANIKMSKSNDYYPGLILYNIIFYFDVIDYFSSHRHDGESLPNHRITGGRS